MRTNKFRVWEIETRRMRYGGNYLIDGTGLLFYQFGYAEPMPLDRENYLPLFWTGVYDKNGREIYEGDICRAHDWNTKEDGSKVLSEANKYYYNVVIDYRVKTPFVGYTIHDWYEVIGNIHESPELLDD